MFALLRLPCRRVFRLDLRLILFPGSPRPCGIFSLYFSHVFLLLHFRLLLDQSRAIWLLLPVLGGAWPSGKESACQRRRRGVNPWVGKSPRHRKWRPTPGFLPGKSHGRMGLAGYSPWGRKDTDTTETLSTPRPGDVQRGSQLTRGARFSTSGAFQSWPASTLLHLQCVGKLSLTAITCPRPHSWEVRI